MKQVRYILGIALFALAAPVWADSFSGKVVAVTDGDTIQVMRNGKAEKVRLHGVDSPESHQDYGTRAKQFTSDLVFGKMVTVDIKDTDRYGRIVGEVINQDGSNLNRELVKNGMAWWYRQYAPNDTTLQQLEKEAKAASRGLWAAKDPIAPWDFRRGETGPPAEPVTTSPISSTTSSLTPKASESTTGEVYITTSGKKYHIGGCRYLSKSKIPTTIEDASARGYTPCLVCNPIKAKGTMQEAPPAYREYVQEEAPATTSATVYVTKTGGKYHSSGCQYLSNSQIPMSLSDAKSSGYGACSRCSPPR